MNRTFSRWIREVEGGLYTVLLGKKRINEIGAGQEATAPGPWF